MWTVPLPCLMTGGFKHSPVAPSPTFPIPFKYHPKSGRSWMFWRQGSSVVMRLKIVFFRPMMAIPLIFTHTHFLEFMNNYDCCENLYIYFFRNHGSGKILEIFGNTQDE